MSNVNKFIANIAGDAGGGVKWDLLEPNNILNSTFSDNYA